MSSSLSTQNRKITFLLILTFFLGLCLRLYKLDHQSFWLDEYYNIYLAQNLEFPHFNFGFLPPFYLFILNGWLQIAPLSEVSARLPSALIGSFSILIFYLLGKELFNRKVGLWASLFLSISAIHVDYCQEARYYSLMLLWASLIHLEYIKILRYNRRKDFIWYGILSTLGLFTYYLLAILFIIHMVHLAVHFKAYQRLIPKILLVQGISSLIFSPLIPYYLKNFLQGAFAWIPPPTPSSLLEALFSFIAGQHWKLSPIPNFNFLSPHIWHGGFFVLMALYSVFRCYKKRVWSPAFSLVLLWAIFPMAFLYIVSVIFFPLFHIRYVLVCVLGFYLFLAWLISEKINIFNKRIWPNILIGTMTFLYIFNNASSLNYYYRHPTKGQYREVAMVIKKNYTLGEKILVRGYHYDGRLLEYYLAKGGLNIPVKVNTQRHSPVPEGYVWIVDLFRDVGMNQFDLIDVLYGINLYRRSY